MTNVVHLRRDVFCGTPRKGGAIVNDVAVAAHLRALQAGGRHSPETIYYRRQHLARLGTALGKPLLEASAAELAAWREALTVAPGTITDYVVHTREFYGWAVREQLLDGDSPAVGLVAPRRARRLPRPIGEDDLLAAVDDAPPRIRPWLVLAGWAGLRAKEIAFLRRENVLDTARQPGLLIAEDATKGHREHLVPLCPFALEEILAAGLPASGWVYRRLDGRPGPNSPNRVSHLCNEYLHSLGIDATLHQCRHRFATEMFAEGGDLRQVQELLGHASPTTTSGYVAWNQAGAADVVARLRVPRRLKVVGG